MTEEIAPHHSQPLGMVLKDGLLVPADVIKPPCAHQDVAQRVQYLAQQTSQFVCKDCNERVYLKWLNFLLGPKEELEKVLAQLEAQQRDQREAMRRKKMGLVLPGEKP